MSQGTVRVKQASSFTPSDGSTCRYDVDTRQHVSIHPVDLIFTAFPYDSFFSPPPSKTSAIYSHLINATQLHTFSMRFTALFPMACAIVAFILGMLCLFAGHKPGFMEDYHILTVSSPT